MSNSHTYAVIYTDDGPDESWKQSRDTEKPRIEVSLFPSKRLAMYSMNFAVTGRGRKNPKFQVASNDPDDGLGTLWNNHYVVESDVGESHQTSSEST